MIPDPVRSTPIRHDAAIMTAGQYRAWSPTSVILKPIQRISNGVRTLHWSTASSNCSNSLLRATCSLWWSSFHPWQQTPGKMSWANRLLLTKSYQILPMLRCVCFLHEKWCYGSIERSTSSTKPDPSDLSWRWSHSNHPPSFQALAQRLWNP